MRDIDKFAKELVKECVPINDKIISKSWLEDTIRLALLSVRREALLEAAKIVESPIYKDKCYACDCHGECPQEYYPPSLRALAKEAE